MSNISPVLAIRKAIRLTQADLAEKIGVGQTNVCAYERGRQGISPATAKAIVGVAKAAGLDISMDHVYGLRPLPEKAAE
jgi:transcriptional regulator with XRE-family HTH domain